MSFDGALSCELVRSGQSSLKLDAAALDRLPYESLFLEIAGMRAMYRRAAYVDKTGNVQVSALECGDVLGYHIALLNYKAGGKDEGRFLIVQDVSATGRPFNNYVVNTSTRTLDTMAQIVLDEYTGGLERKLEHMKFEHPSGKLVARAAYAEIGRVDAAAARKEPEAVFAHLAYLCIHCPEVEQVGKTSELAAEALAKSGGGAPDKGVKRQKKPDLYSLGGTPLWRVGAASGESVRRFEESAGRGELSKSVRPHTRHGHFHG